MIDNHKIQAGFSDAPVYLEPSMANRHGLIAGATGTGKTTTLKVLAEGFSDLGVPVFLADAKGDVSSLAMPGKINEKVAERLEKAGIEKDAFTLQEYPVRFWDVYGKQGLPIRATVTDFGPQLFSRLLNLTPAQSGVLEIIFRAADERGWELIDLKDLQAMVAWASENRKELSAQYGNISSASAGAVQRALLSLENQGADQFFGLPALNIADWISTAEGRGTINLLEASKLMQNPLLYSAFMIWMLAELNEILPEAGDAEKPKLVFFFDEAHMIFDNAPKALVDSIAQTVRLIRSKGVGLYFITQNPSDIPASVLSQLSNRFLHSLHAYTPAEQKGIKAAADGFRKNPAFDTKEALEQLGTGEALVSTLDADGVPGIVQKTMILPCQSSFDALKPVQITAVAAADPMYETYAQVQDPRSAYEILQEQKLENEKALQQAQEQEKKTAPKAARKKDNAITKAAKSTARSFGRQAAREITRTALGSQSKTVQRTAANFAGSLVSNLLGSLFK